MEWNLGQAHLFRAFEFSQVLQSSAKLGCPHEEDVPFPAKCMDTTEILRSCVHS
jgi:hypothetical protein